MSEQEEVVVGVGVKIIDVKPIEKNFIDPKKSECDTERAEGEPEEPGAALPDPALSNDALKILVAKFIEKREMEGKQKEVKIKEAVAPRKSARLANKQQRAVDANEDQEQSEDENDVEDDDDDDDQPQEEEVKAAAKPKRNNKNIKLDLESKLLKEIAKYETMGQLIPLIKRRDRAKAEFKKKLEATSKRRRK